MKLAIFDMGQTLVLNQETYEVFVKKQIEKISAVFIPTLKEHPVFKNILTEQ